MSPPPGLPQRLKLNEQGRIDVDVSCVHCGYDLHSILPDANCPECGNPAHDSLRTDRLMFADPAWLRTIVRGLDLTIISMGITGVMVGILPEVAYVQQLRWQSYDFSWLRPFMLILMILPLAVGVVATCFITTPQPRHRGFLQKPWRISQLISSVALSGAVVMQARELMRLGQSWTPGWLLVVCTALALYVLMGSIVGVRHLTARLPEPSLLTAVRIVGVLMMVSMLAAVGLSLAWVIWRPGSANAIRILVLGSTIDALSFPLMAVSMAWLLFALRIQMLKLIGGRAWRQPLARSRS